MADIAEHDLKVGDRVVVTRENKSGSVTRWPGTITAVSPDACNGFGLAYTDAGLQKETWCSNAEILLRDYGCIQTVTAV